jgi:hypothetical protein
VPISSFSALRISLFSSPLSPASIAAVFRTEAEGQKQCSVPVGCRLRYFMQGHTQLSRRNKQLHDFSVVATAYRSFALCNSDKYSRISDLRALASSGLGSPVGEPSPVPPTQAQHLVNTYSQSTTAQRHRKHRNHYLPKALQQWVLISGNGYTTDIVPEIRTFSTIQLHRLTPDRTSNICKQATPSNHSP